MVLMDNTYFEYLPTEIIYIILDNLSTADIFKCEILGRDIYKNHNIFFQNLIKKDFGDDIKTELISYNRYIRLERYNNFLSQYLSQLYKIYELDECAGVSLDLNTSTITSGMLPKLGVNISFDDKTLRNSKFSVSISSKYAGKYNLYRYDSVKFRARHTSILVVLADLSTIKNLLFLFGVCSIFTCLSS